MNTSLSGRSSRLCRLCFCVSLVLAATLGLTSSSVAQSPEYRGFWVYAWNSDLWNASGINTVVADTRAANMNMVIPQVRRRGDALYNSNYEPKCRDVNANFDPLADLIAKAHNISTGRRIEVHPWIVTYHVWKTSSTYPVPPQPTHPVNLHSDWLLEDYDGNTLIGGEYTFDPGHPEVQRHTFNVCMDIISRYDVDGLNFDYIRYSSTREGYNPVTVERFNRLHGRSGKPATNDVAWTQFRRDQVTALLRKVYLHAIALKPHVKISCDTITWTPAPTDDATWYSSTAAWRNVLQDWRGWMQEGIMDLNIPMAYFRQTVSAHALAYTNWSNFTKDHRFNRHAAIGPGIYLNSISGSIAQYRQTRQTTGAGNKADGVLGYAFHLTNTNSVPRSTFMDALTKSSAYDPISPPIFGTAVSTPTMTWKTTPTLGHTKGFVYVEGTNTADGASIIVNGPANRTQTSDATGFFGFVDLQPGSYSVRATFPGFEPLTNQVTVAAGTVTTTDFSLEPLTGPSFSRHPVDQSVEAGSKVTFIAETSGSRPLSYQWRLNAQAIPGATTNFYIINEARTTNEGVYTLFVSNAVSTATSSNAVLKVTTPPAPQFNSIEVRTNGMVALGAGGNIGQYAVDWSADLSDWFLLTNISVSSAQFELLDAAVPTNRFYRVRRLY